VNSPGPRPEAQSTQLSADINSLLIVILRGRPQKLTFLALEIRARSCCRSAPMLPASLMTTNSVSYYGNVWRRGK
jgi:hypothetical protein